MPNSRATSATDCVISISATCRSSGGNAAEAPLRMSRFSSEQKQKLPSAQSVASPLCTAGVYHLKEKQVTIFPRDCRSVYGES